MHAIATLRAETVTRNPSSRQICLFQSALWGVPGAGGAVWREMRPAFTAGGFALPPFRRDAMLIVDAGMALPPCAGYVDEVGRARGGRSALLVVPPCVGGPCLRHVHIAAGDAQAERHHPSERVGMVVRGRGLAHRRTHPPIVLAPGRAWKIPPGERHRFEAGDAGLDMLVFQPDSLADPAGPAPGMDATAP